MASKGKMFHNKQNKFTTIQFFTHIIKQDKFIPNTYIIKNNYGSTSFNYGATSLPEDPPVGLGLKRASTKLYPCLLPCDPEPP
jgi:hypothetical protein